MSGSMTNHRHKEKAPATVITLQGSRRFFTVLSNAVIGLVDRNIFALPDDFEYTA